MTSMVLDNTWIYCFGEANDYDLQKGFEIERLDTDDIEAKKWENLFIKNDSLQCCQQGVIPLNSGENEHERRFLVFGGVHEDFCE